MVDASMRLHISECQRSSCQNLMCVNHPFESVSTTLMGLVSGQCYVARMLATIHVRIDVEIRIGS
jgi:hypothetical protein